MGYAEQLDKVRQAEAAGAAARRQVRNQARQISDKLVVVMDHLLSLRDEEGFSDALGDAVAATLTTLASRVGAEQENLALMKPAVEEASEALRRAATAYDSLPSESLTMGQLKMAEVLSSDPGFDRAEQLEKWRADAKAEREEAARIALEKFNNEMREAAGQLPQPPAPPSSDEP